MRGASADPVSTTVAMFIGLDWAAPLQAPLRAPLQAPLDAGMKGDVSQVFVLHDISAGDSGNEKKGVKCKENMNQGFNSVSGSNTMEVKRKASMQSFYSSSVSSSTYTSFPPHPDDSSSLWPRVSQVLQMSRHGRGW